MSKKCDFNTKKIYPFHQKEIDEKINILINMGEVVSNSPFIRFHIYKVLNQKNIKFKTEIVDYGSIHRLGYSRGDKYQFPILFIQPKTVMSHLLKNRFQKSDLEKAILEYHHPDYYADKFEEKEVLKIFNTSKEEKYKIIQDNCGNKISVFSYVKYRKPILKIIKL